MTQLIVLRHGQSQWNLDNRFTGWFDVGLTDQGRQEAARAGQLLLDAGLSDIDIAHTSRLQRAIHTLWVVLEQLDRVWIDVHRHWQLNERHYGALQGLNKAETVDKYGKEQVHIWRRSYDTPPAPVTADSPMNPANDSRYQDIPTEQLPTTESLLQVRDRIIPLWKSIIAPQIGQGKKLLITAHGNSLRALAMYLMDMSPEQVMEFNIATGVPLVFDITNNNRAERMYFLEGNEKSI